MWWVLHLYFYATLSLWLMALGSILAMTRFGVALFKGVKKGIILLSAMVVIWVELVVDLSGLLQWLAISIVLALSRGLFYRISGGRLSDSVIKKVKA